MDDSKDAAVNLSDRLRRELGLAPNQSPCSVAGCEPLRDLCDVEHVSKEQARENTARCQNSPDCWLAALIEKVGVDRFGEMLDAVEEEPA